MSSELLKQIAAGEAFDLVEGVREIARVLTEKARAVQKPLSNFGEKPLSNSPQLGERTGSGRATVARLPTKGPMVGSSNGAGKE